MADFMQAIQWMKEGKMVTRNNCNFCLRVRENGEIAEGGTTYHKTTIDDIEAIDWGIFEEEKHSRNDCFDRNDIKRCKNQILKDIESWFSDESISYDCENIINKRFGDL